MRFIVFCTVSACASPQLELPLGPSPLGPFRALEEELVPLEQRDQPTAPRQSLAQRMRARGVPGVSVALIRKGQVEWVHGAGWRSAETRAPVANDTQFSVGSVSKVVNAALILRLVGAGLLDLDADVNGYLKRWRVPDSEFKGPVTLRQILSHTAGFTQHGFADYQPGEELPTLLQTLNGSGPAKNDPIVVDFTPGSDMRYSGGGVQVSQLVIEDVTGLSYEQAARTYVFEPLKMSRSTFAEPTGNVACAHDSDGKPRALPRCYESMPESAASGLWTTAGDLGKFVVAIMGDEAFLPASLRAEMASRVPGSWHGLGPRVNGKALHHGGANDSYRAWIEGHPESGDGVVILTNGEGGRPLAYELRLAVERAYGWDVHFPDDFKAP